jgi:hypothetical protein
LSQEEYQAKLVEYEAQLFGDLPLDQNS